MAELDFNLLLLDGNKPVKYDFALFGMGILRDFESNILVFSCALIYKCLKLLFI